MKTLIGLCTIFISVSAFSNTIETVFKTNTIIPRQAQTKILDALAANCPFGISAWGLSEINSTLVEQENDSGSQLNIFETSMNSRYSYDGMHPSRQTILFKTMVTGDAHNPAIDVKVEILQGHCDDSGR
jgi:hypothetical protein